MYRAQYRDLHTPRVSQSEIGDHSDNFSSTSSLKEWIAEIIESKFREKLFLRWKHLLICDVSWYLSLFIQTMPLKLECFDIFAHFPLFVSKVIHLQIASKELKLAATSKNPFEFQWSFNGELKAADFYFHPISAFAWHRRGSFNKTSALWSQL